MNLFRRLHTSIHRRVLIMAKELSKDNRIAEQTNVSGCFLSSATLGAYALFRPEQRDIAAQRLKEGHRAALICEGERIVGAIWAATDQAYIPYIDRDVLLRPREIYTYDAFTSPDYRQRGIAGIRNNFLVHEYRALGYERAAAIVAFENQAGIRSAEAAGYMRVGVFSCVRLGITQLNFSDSGTGNDIPRFVPPLRRPTG